jgi:DNA replication and repair protein RecF
VALTELRVEGLRCIESAELELGPGTNLVFGPNGAGKTSLLEAAFLLGAVDPSVTVSTSA